MSQNGRVSRVLLLVVFVVADHVQHRGRKIGQVELQVVDNFLVTSTIRGQTPMTTTHCSPKQRHAKKESRGNISFPLTVIPREIRNEIGMLLHVKLLLVAKRFDSRS